VMSERHVLSYDKTSTHSLILAFVYLDRRILHQ
jgi:hypothetical protein